MVCDRCIMVVRHEFEKLNLFPSNIILGEVTTLTSISEDDKSRITAALNPLGFELIDDKKNRITEQIKNTIIDLIYNQELQLKTNLSDLLREKTNFDYHYLSTVFSETEGTTIEKYFIAQKIERVKELLAYDELSLSEISNLLHYSSVAYLSNQFKKVTGFTPSEFKKKKDKNRSSLDQV